MQRVAVYKTGHEIADTVANAIMVGLDNASLHDTSSIVDSDCSIAYGILRGAEDVFRRSKLWFNLDRGYFHPSHYDGYYRISLQGTQQTRFWPDSDDSRLNALGLDIKPWRGLDFSKPVLVCPPTDQVVKFFGLRKDKWLISVIAHHPNYVIRQKGDQSPINFQDYNYVHTFNSSVGWQALMAGIPCVSDPTHSMAASWFYTKYGKLSLDELAQKQLDDRYKLFTAMSNLQLTLDEIKQGKLWPLMISMCSLGSTTGRPLPVMSAPTASSSGLNQRFQSGT